DLDLLASDLAPAAVVADHGDDRYPMAHEGVELGQAVAQRAIAEQRPDLGSRPAELCAEREPRADTQCAERAGVEPAQRAARLDDIRGRRHEVAAVADQDAIGAEGGLDLGAEMQRVDPANRGARLAGDLVVAGLVARAQLRLPAR